jgi:hypothetical protein
MLDPVLSLLCSVVYKHNHEESENYMRSKKIM